MSGPKPYPLLLAPILVPRVWGERYAGPRQPPTHR